MTTTELNKMVADRRKYGKHPASDPALLVLLLMETEEYANDYCNALMLALVTYPDTTPKELETELNKYI